MAIIKSVLDTDLYKLTQMWAILQSDLSVPVEYRFANRRCEGKFTPRFLDCLKEEIQSMADLKVLDEEISWLEQNYSFLPQTFLEYLRNYRFNPSEVEVSLDNRNELQCSIHGEWGRTVLWEVPLMSIISELYFREIDNDWMNTNWQEEQKLFTKNKANILDGFLYSDFGTRRRRSFAVQDLVVHTFMDYPSFVGTSNVHLSHKYGIKALGTVAHEWFMGVSVLRGLRHANHFGLELWQNVFGSKLGIALTDTFGTKAFFNDFNPGLSRLFDGVRHDSGDPIVFAERVIRHYKDVEIDPTTKTIVFSDSLTAEKARDIGEKLKGKIRVSFGIGTHFTNLFPSSPALNMVIKLYCCNGVPVVKLSDSHGKSMGDPDALRVARWTFQNTPLDTNCLIANKK